MIKAALAGAAGLALAAMVSRPALAQGCAMCGSSAGDAADPLARSLSASILFMMSVPFLLFFSVAGWLLYRLNKRGGHVEPGPERSEESPS